MTTILIALAVACVAWTVTNEEVFREPREYCKKRSGCPDSSWWCRKFFYLFTCQYCFSHYVAAIFVLLSDLKAAVPDVRGTVVAYFVVVGIANVFMTLYGIGRQTFKLLSLKAKELDHAKNNDRAQPPALHI